MLIKRDTSTKLESAESWTIQSSSGQEYLVQIGFPRDWSEDSSSTEATEFPVPIVYLTDGNAVFLTALEALHRRLSLSAQVFSSGVVVSIGYPIKPSSRFLFDGRRAFDLTPPTPDSSPGEGGADEFADCIEHRVRPLVHRRLKERRNGAIPGKEAIYGHSFGGLFSLHILFTRPGMFDTYIASSPSIWYKDGVILQEESSFCKDRLKTAPSLMLYVGGEEQDPRRRKGENEEEYENRKKKKNEFKMVDRPFEMYGRLEKTDIFKNISVKKYEGEDHGTVISCSVSQGLINFFEDWPFEQ